MKIPIIDLQKNKTEIAHELFEACTKFGFFYIQHHLVDISLQKSLEVASQLFFELPVEEKMKISMKKGGKAWRGYFPLLDELTSGKPDLKEGIYFGQELPPDHPKVIDKIPMHGQNLFPEFLPELAPIVIAYMHQMTELGHTLMKYISLSLDLKEDYIQQHFTYNPLTLFRIFHYPATTKEQLNNEIWGVGEHTDYGLLTILKQDEVGGLQIKSNNKWIDAPYIENTFICNIGDMLEKLTGGIFVSTPHRVLNTSGKNRYSYPFFFDPSFDAVLHPIEVKSLDIKKQHLTTRWDNQNVHEFNGTYGDYILGKVSKVFPTL